MRAAELALVLALALSAAALAAERMVTEVFTIGFRTVDEMVSVVRPLVPPPGSVSGVANQLVVRTTPENLAEVRQVLAALDRAPRNLMISVRYATTEEMARERAEIFGRVAAGGATVEAGRGAAARGGASISGGADSGEIGARLVENRSRAEDRAVQRVQVLEGREAFIQAGESVPFAQRNVIITGGGATVHDTIQYRDVTTGFYVRPRLHGDQITLEILPRQSRLSPRGGGVVDVQAAQTTVSGRLGEWLEIGGTSEDRSSDASGILHSTRRAASGQRSMFLKVDEVLRR